MQHQSIADRVLRPRGEAERRVRAAPVNRRAVHGKHDVPRDRFYRNIRRKLSGGDALLQIPDEIVRIVVEMHAALCARHLQIDGEAMPVFREIQVIALDARKKPPLHGGPGVGAGRKCRFGPRENAVFRRKNRSHARADVVVDLSSFRLADTKAMAEAQSRRFFRRFFRAHFCAPRK